MTEPDPITSAQRQALAKLAPFLQHDFYLVGGVAVAAHLSHRTSRDLDARTSSSDLGVLAGACRGVAAGVRVGVGATVLDSLTV